MRFIAHRGNLVGPCPDLENRPEYIINAIESGYDCECDVWYHENAMWLGHDAPQYKLEDPCVFLNMKNLWVHAKNIEALSILKKYYPCVNYFWHDRDPYTLTSKGYVWAYPGSTLTGDTICVMPEDANPMYTKEAKARALGICSDYIVLEKLEEIRRNT